MGFDVQSDIPHLPLLRPLLELYAELGEAVAGGLDVIDGAARIAYIQRHTQSGRSVNRCLACYSSPHPPTSPSTQVDRSRRTEEISTTNSHSNMSKSPLLPLIPIHINLTLLLLRPPIVTQLQDALTVGHARGAVVGGEGGGFGGGEGEEVVGLRE